MDSSGVRRPMFFYRGVLGTKKLQTPASDSPNGSCESIGDRSGDRTLTNARAERPMQKILFRHWARNRSAEDSHQWVIGRRS
jgi:hypothetical protein